jgi:hypothetical protein
MSNQTRQRSGRSDLAALVKVLLLGAALVAAWWLAFSSPALHTEPSSDDEHAEPVAQATGAAPTQPLPKAAESAQPQPKAAASVQPSAAQAPQPPAAAPDPAPGQAAAVPMRQGPVEELSQRFASESRGSTSEQDDARVRAAFGDPSIPSSMLQHVECRRSVCRVQLRWSAEHDASYVMGLTAAVGTFSAPVGIEGAGEPDAQGMRSLVVYFGVTH